ncbi:hypothetical protein JW926_09440 [Candidatus Sumerlaeota bacterium]|nr:hypothetical protein [Candidatus Sumerlaeota bacterium]
MMTLLGSPRSFPEAGFKEALPVWIGGREREKNLFAGFRTVMDKPAASNVTLRITAATLYRFFVNGEFAGHGPARAAKGWFRVDEWNITSMLKSKNNIISIEVAGYNANSYYLLDQPSFIQAEIIAGNHVLTATGKSALNGFDALILSHRIQKVQRTSFQRPFCEIYRIDSQSDAWRNDIDASFNKIPVEVTGKKRLIERRVPLPRFSRISPARLLSEGKIRSGVKRESYWADRSLTGISEKLKGYTQDELEIVLSKEIQELETVSIKKSESGVDGKANIALEKESFGIFDFGRNLTGFIRAKASCKGHARLFLLFDEILINEDVIPLRLGMVNTALYECQPGTYWIETFEPYTLRYLKLISTGGEICIDDIEIREYANDDVWVSTFSCSDIRLNRVFEAARETFRQNSPDIFMDCPSRERAGWLCDSFFTGRACRNLCSSPSVEKNFLENFLLADNFDPLPKGMLPMCYPADHYDGVYIPNWALWFIVELEEYLLFSGDRELVEGLRDRVLKLLDFFGKYRNGDGLLEKLDSWVFLEWSAANSFTQDVNYPTNMLYAGALSSAGRMYDMPHLLQEGDKIREGIRKQSFDGEFFVDNAVRKNGNLERTRNRSEICQYYAFFFDVATVETHKTLWERLCVDFAPGRDQAKTFPDIHPINAFIGRPLRLCLLSREGLSSQALHEIMEYNLYMADLTGTLWENNTTVASCNHGFASYVAYLIYKDILGVREIDPVKRIIRIRAGRAPLDWCEGSLFTPGGLLTVRWRKEKGETKVSCDLPESYTCILE